MGDTQLVALGQAVGLGLCASCDGHPPRCTHDLQMPLLRAQALRGVGCMSSTVMQLPQTCSPQGAPWRGLWSLHALAGAQLEVPRAVQRPLGSAGLHACRPLTPANGAGTPVVHYEPRAFIDTLQVATASTSNAQASEASKALAAVTCTDGKRLSCVACGAGLAWPATLMCGSLAHWCPCSQATLEEGL